jgi:hypothetical protein
MHQFLKFILEGNYMFQTVHLSMEMQFHPDPAARKLSTNQYDIYHCCVYSKKLLMMDRWNCISILILLLESCLQTHMTYTIAVCTVKSS